MKAFEHLVLPQMSQRDVIRLVTKLWETECGHLLGAISRQEYRQTIAALLLGDADAAAGTDAGAFQLS